MELNEEKRIMQIDETKQCFVYSEFDSLNFFVI